ncbi:hypothetical protein PV11_04931 [Exophiala sideris]|uniref:Uncharacterized protein n=1 Tax=Exophiala sideris TaxID=1016849 RepID=A0A0D1Z7S2_9EURO|nr:hypothetical protein PV11_04931 [Exophiala sideris]
MGDTVSNTENLPNPSPLPVRIITHNIRFATDTPQKHERLWEDRLHYLSGHFKYHTRQFFSPQSTLVCMQEVLHGQLQDLAREAFGSSTSAEAPTNTGSDWIHVGVGRDDGKTKGEYSPIFFRQSAWECIHTETVWLNESGKVGEKGWDASSIRILTCAVLESRLSSQNDGQQESMASNKTILALNTHLDDQGEVARREAAKLILEVASRLQSKYAPYFTFLTGDLNSEPDGDAYHVLNAPGSGFVDARRVIAEQGNADGKIYAYGNELTFTGFDGDGAAKGKQRIDFVHLGISKSSEEESAELGKAKQMVQGYGVLPSRFDDEVWLSDHRAVVVDLLI